MTAIEVITGVNRYDNSPHYENANILNNIPVAGGWYQGGTVTEVYQEMILPENSSEAFQYDYYRITVVTDGEEQMEDVYDEYLVAVRRFL